MNIDLYFSIKPSYIAHYVLLIMEIASYETIYYHGKYITGFQQNEFHQYAIGDKLRIAFLLTTNYIKFDWNLRQIKVIIIAEALVLFIYFKKSRSFG